MQIEFIYSAHNYGILYGTKIYSRNYLQLLSVELSVGQVQYCIQQQRVRVSIHSKRCGVKLTPPVLIEDHTMQFTPVLNLRC